MLQFDVASHRTKDNVAHLSALPMRQAGKVRRYVRSLVASGLVPDVMPRSGSTSRKEPGPRLTKPNKVTPQYCSTILLVGEAHPHGYSLFASAPLPSSSTMLACASITGSISGVAQVISVVTPGPCPASRQSLCTTMPMVMAPLR